MDNNNTNSSTSTPQTPTSISEPTTPLGHTHEALNSLEKTQSSLVSLFHILSTPLPPALSSSTDPAFSLLHDAGVASRVSGMVRDHPGSGTGDDNLCRWLYDTYQTGDPNLQLVVLRFVPLITGVYLSRVARKKTLAGFEAVLLALYGSETVSRAGQAITVSIPDLSHSSIYHESKSSPQNMNSTELNMAIISPSLEPHGTVRSTRRARIVGVALELYFSKISQMPLGSKLDFCEFCEVWAGQDGDMFKDGMDQETNTTEVIEVHNISDEPQPPSRDETTTETQNMAPKEGRVPLPWELMQPILRILGHCLMGLSYKDKALYEAASSACRSLYARSMHDVSPRAMLATESLLKLGKMKNSMVGTIDGCDHDPTDFPKQIVITL